MSDDTPQYCANCIALMSEDMRRELDAVIGSDYYVPEHDIDWPRIAVTIVDGTAFCAEHAGAI